MNFEINLVLPSLLLVFVEKSFNLPIHPPSRQLSLTYPILSIMARDIMSVPASTTSSESTFSLSIQFLRIDDGA